MAILFDGRVKSATSFPPGYGIQANGIDSQTNHYPNGVPGRIELVNDPAGSGETVIKYRIGKNDTLAALGRRAELYWFGPANGETVWFYWETLIKKGDIPLENGDFVVAQMHDTPDVGDAPRPPTMVVEATRNGMLDVYSSFGPDAITAAPKLVFDKQLCKKPITFDYWQTWAMRVVWSGTIGVGEMDIWINHNKVYLARNQINNYNDVEGPHWKQGIYDYWNNAGWSDAQVFGKGLIATNGDAALYNEFMEEIGSQSRETEPFQMIGVSFL